MKSLKELPKNSYDIAERIIFNFLGIIIIEIPKVSQKNWRKKIERIYEHKPLGSADTTPKGFAR